MVRRLSYINNFNLIRSYEFNMIRISKINASVNAVYWMRKPFNFKFVTKHHRRQSWRRRKHTFEYIVYTNVLSMWSTEYVFFRKLTKFNYNYCLMKTSLLVYNLAFLRGTNPSTAQNSEHAYLSTLPKTIVNYFSNLDVALYAFWRQPTGTLVAVSSFYSNNSTDKIFKTCLISPSHYYTTSTLVPYKETSYITTSDSLFTLVDSIVTKQHYSLLLELYKIHIFLVLYVLNKS